MIRERSPDTDGANSECQEQLSFRVGPSQVYSSGLERALKSPTVETLFRICDALDVSVVTIIRRVGAARKRNQG
jgi:transcriptional regulator with XRE-family HTH domain